MKSVIRNKQLLSLFMAMIMLFVVAIPSVAAEAPTAKAMTTGVISSVQTPEARIPSFARLYQLRVFPAQSGVGYYDDVYTYANCSAEQINHISIDSATWSFYKAQGCNMWFMEMDVGTATATRYELYLNGSKVASGSVQSNRTVTAGVPIYGLSAGGSATYKIVLYDNQGGKPLWGTIYA